MVRYKCIYCMLGYDFNFEFNCILDGIILLIGGEVLILS